MNVRSERRIGVLAIVVAACALVGPAPGESGGCTQEQEYANAETFCRERQFWSCSRKYAQEVFTLEQARACVAESDTLCAEAAWSPDCDIPTEGVTRACVDALRDEDKLDTPEECLEECTSHALCGAPREACMPVEEAP